MAHDDGYPARADGDPSTTNPHTKQGSPSRPYFQLLKPSLNNIFSQQVRVEVSQEIEPVATVKAHPVATRRTRD
jgi:hypothetical protein